MSEDEIRIWLTRKKKSPYWIMRYHDPETGKIVERSTETRSKREAEREVGKLRADLSNGRVDRTSNISWSEFRRRYEDEVIPGLAPKTRLKIATVFNVIEEILKPERLRDLTAPKLSQFQAKLRSGGRAETTISGYMAHLRSALNWAVDMELIPRLPKIPKPKRAKQSKVMKGRPVTDGEFDQMLAAIESVVGAKAAPSWRYYLEGLWWSGLRLAESLELYWNDDSKLCVVFLGEDVMLRIPGELEKGNKDRLLPIAPEFAEFLLQTSEDQRTGRVFRPMATKVRGERLTVDRVSRIISKIGRVANVVVDQSTGKPATAHDLRRSFGERWAALVMPQVLMELMRHESIDTTLRFYVGRNAQRTAKILREAYDQARKAKESRDEDGPRDTSRDTGEADSEGE
jgi:integrase